MSGLPAMLLAAVTLPLRVLDGARTVAAAILTLTDRVGDLHAELAGLRDDLSSMPADSRRLADQVAAVHSSLGVLLGELDAIKLNVAPVHDDLGRVEEGLAPLPDKLDTLLPKIDELAFRLAGLRTDLHGQLDALRTDLSALPFVTKT